MCRKIYKENYNIHALQRVLLLTLSLFLGLSSTHAITINFDQVYGNSGNVSTKIQRAIDDASAGDVIKFNSPYYYLADNQNILINKAITFQGATPVGFNQWTQGASGIKTMLDNTATFSVRANNVKFKNLKMVKKNQGQSVYDILIDARHNTYFTTPQVSITQLQYTGLVFENVELNTGAYLIHAGNGIGATMTNVSFLGFRRIGFWTDRKGRINNMKRASFDRCLFVPDEVIEFDDRAISLDAGNTEYPVIWNNNNTTVYNCKIVNSGIALSRCHNMTIELCTFDDYYGLVDLVHIEEFSYDVRVKNNTFNCQSPDPLNKSKILLIDRELQISSYLTITDNTIKGSYNFFISAYAPHHLTVTGNDFTDASSVNSNSINLTYYEVRDSEPIPFEIVSNHITIANNPGLGLSKNKSLTMFLPSSGAVYSVNGYSSGQQNISYPTTPFALIGNGTYEIVNKANGRKLASSGTYGVTTKNSSGNDAKWRSYWSPPYTYRFQNVETGNWLETHAGYTEFDIFNNQPQNIYPFINSYGNGAKLPFWCLVRSGSDIEIFPGGNEKQSALATDGNAAKLIFGKKFNANGTRSPVVFGNNAKWTFNYIGGLRTSDIEESITSIKPDFSVYPNPATDILHVYVADKGQEKSTVKIIDIQGNVVIQEQLLTDINHALDISGLNTGVYLVKNDTGNYKRVMIK